MKFIIFLLSFTMLLNAADFNTPFKSVQYKTIDNKFTIGCDCGTPAILLPYNGEDIPLAKTMPCPLNGCQS